jgi:S1-C subfamily serine protease
LVRTVKRTSPSVAYITTGGDAAPGFSSDSEVPAGAGSGFLWDKQGHVVTNCHVVLAPGLMPASVKAK